ncbi:hypothetical protein O181_055171 [Austropuccinia psidii MF-1]|uniref:Uncharacterized protein n=1 Tax=Austropuccinia psidii MF-1 TaxID=1389203 RepID=A0A9Q3HRT5_9BASI|nr:hypothetical protein [Austropuccinia psidii MF-1]
MTILSRTTLQNTIPLVQLASLHILTPLLQFKGNHTVKSHLSQPKINSSPQEVNSRHESSPPPIHDIFGFGYEYAYRPTELFKPLQPHHQQYDHPTPKAQSFKFPSARVDSDDLELAEKRYKPNQPDSYDSDQIPEVYQHRKKFQPKGASLVSDTSTCFVPATIPIPQPNNSTSTALHQGDIAKFNHTAYSQLRSTYRSPECQPSPILPFDIKDPYKPSTWNEYSPFNHTNQSIQRRQDIGGSSHVFTPGSLLMPKPIPFYGTSLPHTTQPQGLPTCQDSLPFSQPTQPTNNLFPPSLHS